MDSNITREADALREELAALRAALRDMQADRDQWCLQANWAIRAQIKAEAEADALREELAAARAALVKVTEQLVVVTDERDEARAALVAARAERDTIMERAVMTITDLRIALREMQAERDEARADAAAYARAL